RAEACGSQAQRPTRDPAEACRACMSCVTERLAELARDRLSVSRARRSSDRFPLRMRGCVQACQSSEVGRTLPSFVLPALRSSAASDGCRFFSEVPVGPTAKRVPEPPRPLGRSRLPGGVAGPTDVNRVCGDMLYIEASWRDVRFTPKSGHWLSASGCPL